ncbi:MFS transporter [Desulfobacca acetoxidans]|nr:hypothetical protein [Desulfobacterales bacterium]
MAEVQSERRGPMLFTVSMGAFMATLDTSIVNVALPHITQDLETSLAAISWVMMAYLISTASLLFISGRLGDMLAPGRLFLAGVIIFGLASAACGISRNAGGLVFFRAIQGMGGALMLGLAPKIITTIFDEGERGFALGLYSTAFASGISIGAPLGGFITSAFGWPYVFFLNLPICGAVFLVGSHRLNALPSAATWRRHALDWPGGLLLMISISLLTWALTQVRSQGWLAGRTLTTLGAAVCMFILLLLVERHQETPLLHRELWGSQAFRLGSAVTVLNFAAVMGTFFLLPFFLVEIFLLPIEAVGWLLAAISISSALVSPVGGFLADRWNNLTVLRLGAALIVLGLGTLMWLRAETPLTSVALVLAIVGTGFGLFQAPNLNDVLQGIRPEMLGLAAGTNSVLKNIGSLLGIALMVTVAAVADQPQANLEEGLCLGLPCFQRAFLLATGIAALNLLLNLLPRRRD